MSPAGSGADVQAAFAASVVDEWVRAGVTDAVVAPGSRSTPLLAALAAEARLRLHVVLDERSAGFVALGLGLATGRPAPVVTTSGTAAVELHPAVVEAHQAGVPLLAVTADRPAELHGVGAPQTIEQEGLFTGATRWAASPGIPDLASAASWRSLASRSVAATLTEPAGPGPVHLNLAFREPLLGDPATGGAPAGRPGGEPWHHRDGPAPAPPPGELVEWLAARSGGRGLLVAGADSDPGAGPALVAMARALRWPLLADPRSGARLAEPEVVAAFDGLLRAEPVRAWVPDVVVRTGQPPASKVLGQWLAGLPPEVDQVLVDPRATWSDPDRRVRRVTSCSPVALAQAVCAALAPEAPATLEPAASAMPAPAPRPGPEATGSGWLAGWQQAEAAAQAAIEAALGRTATLSEPGIARAVLAALPEGTVLVASSSMPVRDLEWFAAPRRGVRVLSNRGANGIDGVVSTTVGVALAGHPTVGLIGDLAFAYDLSALLWAGGRDLDCTFVLVDNDGGGIFSFLPQADLPADRFERLWGTPHGLDLLALAGAYGATGSEVASTAELEAALSAEGRRGVRVLRCRTDRAANVAVHEALGSAIAAALGSPAPPSGTGR